MAASNLKSVQNSFGRNRMPEHFIYLFIVLFYFEWLGIHFFNPLTCDLPDTIPRHWLLTPLPREAGDFLVGSNHSGHMLPLTYLAWLQPICNNSRIKFNTCQYCKSFTCGEEFDKKYRASAKLISNHESIKQQPH